MARVRRVFAPGLPHHTTQRGNRRLNVFRDGHRRGLSMNNVYTLLLACGPQPEGARRRAGICFVAAPRRCASTSPASRRLACARPALAPKWTCYFVTDP